MSRQAADSLPAGSARRAASGDCGFTILEALIATGIVTLIAFTGLAACKAMAQVMLWSSGARHSAASVDTQAAQLRNDAASAFAVFAPESDMYGRMNDGQELDFYSKADDGRPILWRYFYAAAAQTLQRWDFDPTGARGVRDAKTGVIDAAATYPPLNGITHFRATAISADRLGDPAYNIYSGIGALFTRPPRALPVRYAAVPGGSAAVGGNGVMQVSLTSQAAARVLDLAAGSMPTGFTISGAPVWHAIVYRVDQSHRFLLGTAGKSHVFINARVDVSYDHWASKIAWCDFNLLGNPDGLDPHDPHADYKPNEPLERSENILAACRQRHPLPPARNSADNPADPDTVRPPLRRQTTAR